MVASSHLSAVRLRPPEFELGMIRRARLLRELDTGGKVTLIIAPAGFGKTTLLSNWMETVDGASAWVSLRPDSDTFPGLLRQLASALSPFLAPGANLRQNPGSDADVLEATTDGEALLTAVERSASRWILVLDGFQVIQSPEIHAFIARLIEAMPDECRLIIASRRQPPLSIGRMRLLDELTLLTTEDMSATTAEVRLLLLALGVEATVEQATAIAARTAGWMAALHFVAATARARSTDHVVRQLATYSGDLALLHDYLVQEVLGDRSPAMQDFLLRIAILERFTVDACYAVTGDPLAGHYLEEARRDGLFLSELDDTRTWFGLHPMFRHSLLRELSLHVDPETIKGLHRTASAWFTLHNHDEEGLGHAVQAGDWPGATGMVRGAAFDFLRAHRAADLLRWLDTFPRTVTLADPDLASITAFCLVHDGRIAEALPLVEAADARWLDQTNDQGRAVVEIGRGEIARRREEGAMLIEHAANGLALALGSGVVQDPFTTGVSEPQVLRLRGTWMEAAPHLIPFLQLAVGLTLDGRVAEGVRRVEEILAACVAHDTNQDLHDVLTHVGSAYVAACRFGEAEAILAPLADDGLDGNPGEVVPVIDALAEVLYAQNRLAECERLLRGGIRLLGHRHLDALGAPLHLQLARVRWVQGDLDGALAALDEAAAAATSLQNRRRLSEVRAFRARIQLGSGEVALARRWVLATRPSGARAESSASLAELLMLARVYIASGDTSEAVDLLTRLRATAQDGGAHRSLIQILTLLSVAYLDRFELDQAIETLRIALELGEASGDIRTFIDEGSPMVRLLRIAHRRGVRVFYVNMLLTQSGEAPEPLTKFVHTDLIEPITARELDVLELVALSLTNKEIGEELCITVPTVKRHITNLYGKLGVASRTEAVQRARQLNLLTARGENPLASAVTTAS